MNDQRKRKENKRWINKEDQDTYNRNVDQKQETIFKIWNKKLEIFIRNKCHRENLFSTLYKIIIISMTKTVSFNWFISIKKK